MSKQGFEKFINPKSPGKIKEAYRQEKRKSKAEMRAAGEELRRVKAEKLRGERPDEIPFGGKNRAGKPYNRPNGFYAKKQEISGRTNSKTEQNSNQVADDDRKPDSKTKNYGVKNERFVSDRTSGEEEMPLNKFIAHSGVCGRREAAALVKEGLVHVNGDIIFEPAYKVSEKDTIKLKGKKLEIQKKLVYFLMNKPKDHITTLKDEKGRKTVIDLLKGVNVDRVYPIGRLDRNTTGVLLLTNDGELAQKLTHPSFQIRKIYEVTLDKALTKNDAEAIANGILLEDGEIKADAVGFVDPKDKSIIGIEIHSGRNRIVRRIFEHLGYEVKKLDRVLFANLTKKNVERGKWRYLSEKEVRLLKFMNGASNKNPKELKAEIEPKERKNSWAQSDMEDTEEPKESGGARRQGESAEARRPRKPIGSKEQTEFGRARSPKESGGFRGQRETGEARRPRKPIGSKEQTEFGRARRSKESDGSREQRETGEARRPRKPIGSKEQTEFGRARRPKESDGSREQRETGEARRPRKPIGSKEQTEFGAARRPRESSGARETGESRRPRKPIGSKEQSEFGGTRMSNSKANGSRTQGESRTNKGAFERRGHKGSKQK